MKSPDPVTDIEEMIQEPVMESNAPQLQQLLASIPSLRERVPDLLQNIGQNFGTAIGVYLNVASVEPTEPPIAPEILRFAAATHSYDRRRFGELLAELAEPGAIVVLNDIPASGRRSLAAALAAATSCDDDMTARVMALETFDSIERGNGRLFGGSTYILILPDDDLEDRDDAGPVVDDRFGSRLIGIRSKLAAAASRLILVTEPAQWKRIGHAWDGRWFQIDGADPRGIAQSWLAYRKSSEVAERWTADSRIAALLLAGNPNGQPTAKIAMRLVGLIIDALEAPSLAFHNDAGDGLVSPYTEAQDFDARVQSVVSGYGNWRSKLLRWHRDPSRRSVDRNFLLASAVLRGQSTAIVYLGTMALCSAFGEDAAALTGQQPPGVLELADITESRVTPDSRIEFDLPGYCDAVINYFTADRPLLQEKFLKWIIRLPLSVPEIATQMSVSFNTPELIAASKRLLLDWIQREPPSSPATRPPLRDILEDVVKVWRESRPLEEAAVDVVTTMCLDPAFGRQAHRILLFWAKQSDPILRQTAVIVCAGRFRTVFPDKALVRFAHAAVDAEVPSIAREAVVKIWRQDGSRAETFKRIKAWCDDQNSQRRRWGIATFVSIALEEREGLPGYPELLSAPSTAPLDPHHWNNLFACWHYTIHSRTETGDVMSFAALCFWLDACLDYPDIVTNLVFNILSQAIASHDPDVERRTAAGLFDDLGRWKDKSEKATVEQRWDVRLRLMDQIDKARTERTRNHTVSPSQWLSPVVQ